jgi:hypothetical protein
MPGNFCRGALAVPKLQNHRLVLIELSFTAGLAWFWREASA